MERHETTGQSEKMSMHWNVRVCTYANHIKTLGVLINKKRRNAVQMIGNEWFIIGLR